MISAANEEQMEEQNRIGAEYSPHLAEQNADAKQDHEEHNKEQKKDEEHNEQHKEQNLDDPSVSVRAIATSWSRTH